MECLSTCIKQWPNDYLWDIVDREILQSDWLKAFLAIAWEKKLSLTKILHKELKTIKNYGFGSFKETSNDVIWKKISILIFWAFWVFFPLILEK